MDRRFFLGSLGALLMSALVGGGCAHTQVAAEVPPPRFNGPTIVQATPSPRTFPAPSSIRPKTSPLPAGVAREWIPVAAARPWQYIVIHHSATPSGSAAKFDRDHRAKGWDELGYHFVIGNGTETRNGQIEVGPRWPKQKWGAHAKTADNRFNDFGIGICMVGNFDEQRPNTEQLKSLSKLVAYLMKTYRIPPDRVLGHSDTKATDCPGKKLNVALVRQMATQAMADAGESVEFPEAQARTASAGSVELLTSSGVR